MEAAGDPRGRHRLKRLIRRRWHGRVRDGNYSASCLDFHLSMSGSAIIGSSGSSAARRAHGIPDDEFVAATMGEELSLPSLLAALF